MGRPLAKRFFGNENTGSASTTADDGIGGQSLASITFGGVNNSSGYTVGDALTISAPDLPSGVQAVAVVATVDTGRILTINITEAGSGYTAAPTVSADTGTQGTLTLTGVLTTPTATRYSANAFATIICTAQTTTGGSPLTGDIVAQKGSRRYRVKTTDGTATCSLVTATPAAIGEMTITAQDYSGNTYYVTKLTRHRALITRLSGSTYEFATGVTVGWKTDVLVAGDTGIYVKVASI